jgi:rare lipoprotein A
MTAAHRTLPFGTRVRVTYPKTGKSVEVVINDRGPHVEGRIIDLSGAAARALGLTDDGTGQVRLEVISP